ncbi:hypothetical protein MHZ93_03195 [Roseomonas sp. ACRSG]|nr:hypothetical protein [Roseomonas sp. ACRSG]
MDSDPRPNFTSCARTSEAPPLPRHAGRAKSADTDDIPREILDMSAQDAARLRAGGVI